MRVFDNIAYVHMPKKRRRKLDTKAKKCILVGNSDKQKGYKCYNPQTKHVRVKRDVVFDEFASRYLPSPPNPENSIPNSEHDASDPNMIQEEDIRPLE